MVIHFLKRQLVKACILLLLISPITVFAGDTVFINGNLLLSNCENNEEGYLFCTGYISAVTDSETALRLGWHINSNLQTFCLPENKITVGQLVKVFKKYANNNPQDLHLPAAFLVIQSFTQAWPCK